MRNNSHTLQFYDYDADRNMKSNTTRLMEKEERKAFLKLKPVERIRENKYESKHKGKTGIDFSSDRFKSFLRYGPGNTTFAELNLRPAAAGV